MKILERIFYCTYMMGQKLLSASKKNNCITAIILLLLMYVASLNIPVIIHIAFLCFMVVLFVTNADALISIKKFLGIGFLYWFVITGYVIMLAECQFNIFGNVMVYAIFAISWWFYSLLANNKVATVANQIISTILACVVLLKDTVISLIPSTVMGMEPVAGYTNEQRIEIFFNLTFSPMLAINLFAMLLCTLKGYWIEKYNDNKDLGYQEPENTDKDNTENYDIEKETMKQNKR
ncbi:MAG: hypothetical protein NC428_07625 [Clostridium sp.]|nr:hypothetical protein [Clostridium sp.]